MGGCASIGQSFCILDCPCAHQVIKSDEGMRSAICNRGSGCEDSTADNFCCGIAILQGVPAFVSLRLTFSYLLSCQKLLAEMPPLDSSSGTI